MNIKTFFSSSCGKFIIAVIIIAIVVYILYAWPQNGEKFKVSDSLKLKTNKKPIKYSTKEYSVTYKTHKKPKFYNTEGQLVTMSKNNPHDIRFDRSSFYSNSNQNDNESHFIDTRGGNA